jgi:hypothetical protein
MPTGIYKRSKEQIENATKTILKVVSNGKHNGFLGKIHTEETKKKMRKPHKNSGKLKQPRPWMWGKSTWNKGKKMSGSYNHKGENNPNWCGGLSEQCYSVDWTKTLRRSIRERDRYICKLCNKVQEDISFDVHHIDYDKNNCDPKNLLTLCRQCHIKTNYNRDYWINYFKKSPNL